jgi:L-malate glycosyltransferase
MIKSHNSALISCSASAQSAITDSPPAARRLRRVLWVLDLDASQKFGSLEEQVQCLACAFRDQGGLLLPVFLGPLDPAARARYVGQGLRVEGLDLRRFRVKTFWQLARLIRSERIEVVNWNFYHTLANAYFWALKVCAPGLEHDFTDHDSLLTVRSGDNRRRWKKLLTRTLAARYARILAVSDYVQLRARDRWQRDILRYHYFINTARFQPDPVARREVREALGVHDEFVVLAVACLITFKGIDVALRALAESPQGVQLWIVGEGPEEAHLRELARALNLEARVRFLGLRHRVEPFMQAADVVVCPSLWEEAAGLVNLEAAACGLPVLASRVGGIPEMVEDGRTGLLFTAGQHSELARLIRRLHDDAPFRRTLGETARATAIKRFSPENSIHQVLDLYTK